MGQDDDAGCAEHVWELKGVVLGGGVHAEYECRACAAVVLRAPGEPFPGTV